MSTDGQGTKCRQNIAENFNQLSRVHECYRQTDNRRMGDSTFAKNLRWNVKAIATVPVMDVKLLFLINEHHRLILGHKSIGELLAICANTHSCQLTTNMPG